MLIAILIPQMILANAGTALMWMPLYQLLFGNILIGLVEGSAVSIIFKTKWHRSVLMMIAGNYVSWILGNGLIRMFQESFIEAIFQIKGVFAAWIISLIILYVLTVAIEMPFFNWIFKKADRKWNHSLKLSVILNAGTYLAMILIYLSASKYSFFTDLSINQSLLDKKYNIELILKKNEVVFKGRISNDFKGELIYRIPVNKNNLEFELNLDSINKTVDLFLANDMGDSSLLKKSFIDFDEKINYPCLFEEYSWVISDFRDTLNRNWNANAGGWAIQGLTISNNNEEHDNYAFEVPWMFWGIADVSIINESELICKIEGRLILINKDTKEIAYITKADDYILRLEK